MKKLLATVALCTLPLSATADAFDYDPAQSTFMNWLNGYTEGVFKVGEFYKDLVNAVSDEASDIESPDISDNVETQINTSTETTIIEGGSFDDLLVDGENIVNIIGFVELESADVVQKKKHLGTDFYYGTGGTLVALEVSDDYSDNWGQNNQNFRVYYLSLIHISEPTRPY